MSREYDNELRGVLFKNDRKEEDKHPDYKGSCEIEGVEYWISAWIKESQKGKFMSLSFKPKEEKRNPPAREPKPRGQQRNYGDDEPPF